jgi:hypothetical protein
VLAGRDEVVRVADDWWFGPDGTQPPPTPPLLSDPLSGLVTGELFSDTTSVADVVPTVVIEPVTRAATRFRSRTPVGQSRAAARPLQASGSPDAIPVAAPLSRRLPPAGGNPGYTVPVRVAPVTPRTPPPGRRSGRLPAGTPAPVAPIRENNRRSSVGVVLLWVFVAVVVAIIVLGIVYGHRSG